MARVESTDRAANMMLWCFLHLLPIFSFLSFFSFIYSYQPNRFPSKTTGHIRQKVLKVKETSETYWVDSEGLISFFQNEIPFHRHGWYDEEDILQVSEREIYNYQLMKETESKPSIKLTNEKELTVCPCHLEEHNRRKEELLLHHLQQRQQQRKKIEQKTKMNNKTKKKSLPKHQGELKLREFCFLDSNETKTLFKQLNLAHLHDDNEEEEKEEEAVDHGSLNSKTNTFISYRIIPYRMFYNQYQSRPYQRYQTSYSPTDKTGNSDLASCNLIIRLLSPASSVKREKFQCPERCLPVPYVELPSSIFLLSPSPPLPISNSYFAELYGEDLLLTCSLTWKQLITFFPQLSSSLSSIVVAKQIQLKILEFLLEAIYQRRFMECHESYLWPEISLSSSSVGISASSSVIEWKFPKRKVWGLVLFIGGIHNLELLRDQMRILQAQKLTSDYYIAGWGATEDQYPISDSCGKECKVITTDNQYKLYLPRTFMLEKDKENGLKCGQYRPSRALGHVLHLYDPDFILLADDDTYVSQRVLFGLPLRNFITQYLISHNEIFSEVMESDRDITRDGFIWGGSGYLFGRKVIERLNSYILPGPTQSHYDWSGTNMTKELNILAQANKWSKKKCSGCIKLIEKSDKKKQVGKSKVRVIDLCTNMFSHENSCFSSDHALSLCFSHGTYSKFMHAPSTGHIGHGPTKYHLSMSFDWEVCNSYKTLTCHRFRTDPKNPAFAMSNINTNEIHANNTAPPGYIES